METTSLDMQQYYGLAVNENPEYSSRQKKLLIAGLAVFSQQGYDATTNTEIARAAHVNVADVELHFPSKQRFLNAIFDALISEAVPLMANDFTADTLGDQYSDLDSFLTSVISNRLGFVRVNLPILKLFNSQVGYNKAFQEVFETQLVPMITENLAGVLDQLDPQRPQTVAMEQIKQFIYDAVGGYFLQLSGGADLNEAEQTKMIVQRFKILLGVAK